MTRATRTVLRLILTASVALATMAAGPASAQTKVRLGAQTIGDYIAAYMGQEYGIYAKHGLDVTIQPITISTLAAASLMSGSLDLATSTVPDMIQAVENGIDLVAISGIGVLAPQGGTRSGVVVQPDVNITKASDFVGKKVGISALGRTAAYIVPELPDGQWRRPTKSDLRRNPHSIALRRHEKP